MPGPLVIPAYRLLQMLALIVSVERDMLHLGIASLVNAHIEFDSKSVVVFAFLRTIGLIQG